MGNQSTVLRPEVLSDLENNTAFTADEIRDYYRTFLKDCPSGRMTMSLEEFVTAYNKIFPQGDATKFAEHIFNQFDSDRSGHIDFREFLQALSIQLKGSVEERLEWAFNLYDIDGTGFIERQELIEIARALHYHKGHLLVSDERVTPQQIADYVLERADQNHDNKLSKEEFVTAAVNNPSIRRLILGTLDATGSPFARRKHPQSDHAPAPR